MAKQPTFDFAKFQRDFAARGAALIQNRVVANTAAREVRGQKQRDYLEKVVKPLQAKRAAEAVAAQLKGPPAK